MLQVYCGSDSIGVRGAAFTWVDEQAERGVRVNHLEPDDYAPGIIADALGATSLFGGQELYLIDTPSATKELETETNASLKEMAESDNLFVVIEGALLAAAKKPYQKYATEFVELKAAATERFNVFAMAEALLRRDKKSLWLLFTQAKRAGLSDEEIIGTLWWQLKTLWLAQTTPSAAAAGVKDFPYNKAKRALPKFKDGEVEGLSHSLLRVYHEGHAGMVDTDLALERWVLNTK